MDTGNKVKCHHEHRLLREAVTSHRSAPHRKLIFCLELTLRRVSKHTYVTADHHFSDPYFIALFNCFTPPSCMAMCNKCKNVLLVSCLAHVEQTETSQTKIIILNLKW